MILPASGPASLAAYKKLLEESGEVLVPRPQKCPRTDRDCAGRMWRHSSYGRQAKDASGVATRLEIKRFRCSDCKKIVSCLFCFLVPYVQFVAEAISEWVAFYLEHPCTYDDLEWGEETDVRATVFRKVAGFVEEAKDLSSEVQIESMLSGAEKNIETAQEQLECVNSWKARSKGKENQLDDGASLIEYCRVLMNCGRNRGANILDSINQYFLTSSEKLRSIYCKRKNVVLSNHHSLRCSIF